MHLTSTVTLLAFSWLASATAAARPTWICSLSDDAVRLVCVADADPHDAAQEASAPGTTFNGTVFPLDPRRMYVVEMWSPPSDMAFVEQLARSAVCFRTPACHVVVAEERYAMPVPFVRLASAAAARR